MDFLNLPRYNVDSTSDPILQELYKRNQTDSGQSQADS